jgi:hypothetical protein
MVLAQKHKVGLGDDTDARRDHDVLTDTTHQPEVEIELAESEPTIQQQQAYEQFWKMFLERVVTKKQPNNNNP